MGFLAVTLIAALTAVQNVAQSVDRRIAACKPEGTTSRFLDYPQGAERDAYTLNPRFWAADVDLSCASPWNSCGGRLRAGTLISKRHIIFAKHFPIPAGSRIVFVGQDGGVCPCYVEKTVGLDRSDLMVGLLNAEVTPNVHPAKILPLDYARTVGDMKGLPVVMLNQLEQLSVCEIDYIATNGAPHHSAILIEPKDANRLRFNHRLRVGDSGSPVFVIVGKEAVLLNSVSGGGGGSGPAYHLRRREIQKVMDDLCPGYKLETFDFAATVTSE